MRWITEMLACLLQASDPAESTWQDALRQKLGPPIKALHQPIDEWLGTLPMSVAMACAIGLFVVAGIWVTTLRSEFIFRGAPRRDRLYDLRLWAIALLLPYIGVYIVLG